MFDPSGVKFSFSEPLETSALSEKEELVETVEDIETQHYEVPEIPQNLEKSLELKMNEETDDSTDEDEADNNGGGLNFSWTTIPSQAVDVSVSQIVQEDVATMSFSAPRVEGEARDQDDIGDPQHFEFGDPHDESMDMDAIEEEEEQHEVIEKITEEETETGLDDSDHFALQFEEPQEKVIETVKENIKSKEELVPEPKTPEVEPVPTTPLRRSSRKGSRSQDDLLRAETLPLDKTPVKKTPRTLKTAPAPEVDL